MMRIGGVVVLVLAMLCQSSTAFTFQDMERKRTTSHMQKHYMSLWGDIVSEEVKGVEGSSDSRRDFFVKVGAGALAVGANLAGSGVLAPEPANAVGGLDKVNAKLKGYGLPLVRTPPGGYSPLLEIYGKGKNRFPLLVQFNQPLTWVLTLPNNDRNSEDGTVQIGDYAKGDTATLFVYDGDGHVNNINSQPKEFFENMLIKAISQKGTNVYQSFKVLKVTPQTGPEYDGKEYAIVDFKYELLTGAGFEVERRGIAAITSQGPGVETFWAASIRARFKKTEETLREITSSFRCYADGINFSNDLYAYTQSEL